VKLQFPYKTTYKVEQNRDLPYVNDIVLKKKGFGNVEKAGQFDTISHAASVSMKVYILQRLEIANSSALIFFILTFLRFTF
jgi:hypothetical protein